MQAWDGNESIVLWEDLDGTERKIPESSASRELQRLGTWKPAASRVVKPAERWRLRIRLRDFRLEVEAAGPDGDVVPFVPIHGEDLGTETAA
jgi:hypothetical protein